MLVRVGRLGNKKIKKGGGGAASYVDPNGLTPDHYYDPVNGFTSGLTVACARTGTVATYFDSSGTLQTAAANSLRLTYGSSGGAKPQGLLIEPTATNVFLNSTAPATQSINLGSTGAWTVSCYGTGSVTVTAGTGAATNLGAATDGAPRTINVTSAGTFTFTCSGSLKAAQVETGSFATSPIVTAGASATRNFDDVTLGTITGMTTAGTVAVWLKPYGVNASYGRVFGNTTDARNFALDPTGAGAVFDGTNLGATANVATMGALTKLCGKFSSGNQSVVLNNGTLVSGTGAWGTYSVSTSRLGSDGTNTDLQGGVYTLLRLWNSALSNANCNLATS